MFRKISIFIFLFPVFLNAQFVPGWQHLDPQIDSVLGISTNRAYEYLKNKQSKQVIVAIIDNGAELTHEDLKGQFWINPNEIEGNGIDDDKNGYVDDIHGWNFLGNSRGENIKRETTELTRFYGTLSKKFEKSDSTRFNQKEWTEFRQYHKIKQEYQKQLEEKNEEIYLYQNILFNCRETDKILKEFLKKDSYSEVDLKSIPDSVENACSAAKYMLKVSMAGLSISRLEGMIDNNKQDLETRLNPDFNIRKKIIGDKPDDLNDNKYGNNQVDAQSPYHGTGVAGIIGALYNNIGVDGIAKNVKLMILRALPNGDEQDKDVALSILYAVNNHADIISCSFGKPLSAHPEFVEYAIKKAEQAGVLIVHASGNNGQNNDSIPTYPTGYYADGSRATNWINVGASGVKDDENLLAYFSNYGKKSVDVFAPGVDINACILNNKYELSSGTSIAAPVVAGIAAVLKSYYPKLKAEQMKEIIIKSTYKPKTNKINLPNNQNVKVSLDQISVSGGIASLYNALLLAEKDYPK